MISPSQKVTTWELYRQTDWCSSSRWSADSYVHGVRRPPRGSCKKVGLQVSPRKERWALPWCRKDSRGQDQSHGLVRWPSTLRPLGSWRRSEFRQKSAPLIRPVSTRLREEKSAYKNWAQGKRGTRNINQSVNHSVRRDGRKIKHTARDTPRPRFYSEASLHSKMTKKITTSSTRKNLLKMPVCMNIEPCPHAFL